MTDSQKLDLLLDEIRAVETRLEGKMEEVKTDLQGEIRNLDEKVTTLDERVVALDERVVALDERVTALDEKVMTLDERVTNIEGDNRSIRFLLENEICVNIQRIAEGHLDLARNLKEAQKPSQELEVLTIKVNTLEREVKEIKRKIS